MTTTTKMNKMAIAEIAYECDEKFGTNLSFESYTSGGWGTLSARFFDNNVGILLMFDSKTLEITNAVVTVSTGWDFVNFSPAGTDESGNVEFVLSPNGGARDRNTVDEAKKILKEASDWVNYVLK